LEDNYRHKGLRKQLVDTLRHKGIQDEAVLEAFDKVPRHWFLDQAFADHAYEDKALPIDKDQSISQPYTVARMTELLEVKKHQKVLEIGTGSGYQAAILDAMGARVFTLERHKVLYEKTKVLLQKITRGRVMCFLRDGFLGLPSYSPYDRIIVTAAAPHVPEALLNQLAAEGILVIPVGEDTQEMRRITRTKTGFVEEAFGAYRFVPFLSGVDRE
jgi:protein-L-isoaspartate(D-aspartate) O-methyltransferase